MSHSVHSKQDDYLLGYFAHYVSTERAYYGGLLVTSTHGVPKEFRHSEAIKPSRMQMVLYGDSLETSLGSDALAPALFEALGAKPDVLLVDKNSLKLFGHFAHLHPAAALLIAHADPDLAFGEKLAPESNLLEAKEYALKGSPTERVYAYVQESRERQVGENALEIAQVRMNLMAPFERIRTVLAEISQIDQGRARA